MSEPFIKLPKKGYGYICYLILKAFSEDNDIQGLDENSFPKQGDDYLESLQKIFIIIFETLSEEKKKEVQNALIEFSRPTAPF